MSVRGIVLACSLIICPVVLQAQESPPLTPASATAVFERAQILCQRDGGKMWGASLCSPIMLVEPGSRRIVASVPDKGGLLQPSGDVFVGILPPEQNASYTAFEWSGVRWTQLLWPLPSDDPGERDVLVAHELFHNLQPRLPAGLSDGGDNGHLDTLDGRYYLQLEWRALARALSERGASARAALADALAFRAARHRRFPAAETTEAALELNEGLAEYTGVMVGAGSAADREAAALRDLSAHIDDPSFVRSFAYATGPAYGMLLDRMAAGWRERLEPGANLAGLLRDAARIDVAVDDASVEAAAKDYDGTNLLAKETVRERARQMQLQANRSRFVEGPVLVLDLVHMNVQFDPRSLQPLDDVGTVYPTLRISDDWGVLEARQGALLRADWSAVVIAVEQGTTEAPLRGEGWTLTLNPGWTLVPDARDGDWKLQSPQ